MADWQVCPPSSTNPGNPWVVRDEHNAVIAIMGGFKSAGESVAKQIVREHNAHADMLAALEAYVAYNDHDQSEDFDDCDGDCDVAIDLWLKAVALARTAIRKAKDE